jgi:DNA-binding transcriptional MerR regulator
VSSKVVCFTELDREWFELIVEAKKLGLEISTIKNFLKDHEVTGVLLEK